MSTDALAATQVFQWDVESISKARFRHPADATLREQVRRATLRTLAPPRREPGDTLLNPVRTRHASPPLGPEDPRGLRESPRGQVVRGAPYDPSFGRDSIGDCGIREVNAVRFAIEGRRRMPICVRFAYELLTQFEIEIAAMTNLGRSLWSE